MNLNQPTNQNHPNQNQNHKTTNTQTHETTTKPELLIMIPIEIHSVCWLADYVMILHAGVMSYDHAQNRLFNSKYL